MFSMQKVTIEYVLKTFSDALRLMLATSDHISPINFNNYINNGFPVDSSNKEGYEYLEMTDIDADGFPSDSIYLDALGNTAAWKVWNAGKWRWNIIKRYTVGGV